MLENDYIKILKNKNKNYKTSEIIKIYRLVSKKFENLDNRIKVLRKIAEGSNIDYALGDIDFLGMTFSINENVLIPRYDTECWVDQAIKFIDKNINNKIQLKALDMFTGSGCIGISIARELEIPVDLSDICNKALQVAKDNIKLAGVDTLCKCICSSVFEAINSRYNIIFANPPYLLSGCKYLEECVDPIISLDGGKCGLFFYRKIAEDIKNHLKSDGLLFLEIGYNQKQQVSDIFTNCGLRLLCIYKDLSGIDRCLVFKKE